MHSNKICKKTSINYKKTSTRCSICKNKDHISKKCIQRCMTCADIHHHKKCKLKRSRTTYRHPCSICGSTFHPFIECSIYKRRQVKKQKKELEKKKLENEKEWEKHYMEELEKENEQANNSYNPYNPCIHCGLTNHYFTNCDQNHNFNSDSNSNDIFSQQISEFENSKNYMISDDFWNDMYKLADTVLRTIYEEDDDEITEIEEDD